MGYHETDTEITYVPFYMTGYFFFFFKQGAWVFQSQFSKITSPRETLKHL